MPFPNTTATTGQVVTAAFWNAEIKDNFDDAFPDGLTPVSWTPGLSGTAGNPAVTTTGRRYRIGALQYVWARFSITSITPTGGFLYVTLPAAASGVSASASEGGGQTIGSWTLRDNSVPGSRNGSVTLRASDEAWFNVGPGTLTDLAPLTLAVNDILSFHAVYPYA